MARYANRLYKVMLPDYLCGGTGLTSYQYYAVSIQAGGTITLAIQGATAMLGHQGILMNAPPAGEVCEIATWGSIVPARCKATGPTAIVWGTLLMVDVTANAANRGKLCPAVNGAWCCGIAQEAMSVANDDSEIVVQLITPCIVADVSLWGIGNA